MRALTSFLFLFLIASCGLELSSSQKKENSESTDGAITQVGEALPIANYSFQHCGEIYRTEFVGHSASGHVEIKVSEDQIYSLMSHKQEISKQITAMKFPDRYQGCVYSNTAPMQGFEGVVIQVDELILR